MSWQLGALAVLAAALVAGFGWYERTRPDARVVALVATLAALAALGRVAFAALPNVKPTTDIVLIAGFALGAAPGFAVGATAGLTSNFFFGQGPWTPWQMAAWGAAGVIGALLARVTRGRLGRWPLALVCALVGYAFTTFQDFGDWVNFSDHSAAQLWVYLGRGVPFDLIHAAGCLAFALLFGLPLARALARFTARLHVNWHPLDQALAPVVLFALALGGVGLAARAGPARAAAGPVSYLLGAQNPDGGFGPGPATGSSELYSGWAALGLAAAGRNPADVRRGGASLLAYVAQGAASASDPGAVERTMLVAAASGASSSSFGGRDLIGALQRYVSSDGSISQQVNLTAFAVLALRGAHAPVPSRMAAWLAAQQNRDGGFSFGTRGGGSDIDDTGAVLEALGARQPMAERAIRFLARQQNRDGGFPAQPGQESNAQSTAWAVQGLLAAGAGPDGMRRGGASPFDYLNSLVASDGHIRYGRGSDQTPVWVTGEALMALQRRPLPLAAVPRAGGPRSAARHAASRTRRSSPRRHRRRAARRHAAARSAASPPAEIERLAAGAGVVAALAYAPVGIG